MHLINDETKKTVKIGDRFMDFRKESIYEITGMKEPGRPGSTGRVYCKEVIKGTLSEYESEFFPGVLGLSWSDKENDLLPEHYIKLWAEDFDTDIWNDYCDIASVPHSSRNITIYFDQQNVNSEDYEDDKIPDDSYGPFYVVVRHGDDNHYDSNYETYAEAKAEFDRITTGIKDQEFSILCNYGHADSIWVEDASGEEYNCWAK